MIEQMRVELTELLPMRIREVDFSDPTLILTGDDWSFTAICAWRIIKSGRLAFGWSHPEAADLIWDLCGQSIISVGPQSMLMPGDPVFELSQNGWLEVFSDHATDPWVLRLPTRTFVGSPTGGSEQDQ